jgi:hypothetical protein
MVLPSHHWQWKMQFNDRLPGRIMSDFGCRVRRAACTAMATFVLTGSSQAAIFRCVDANGTNTYSDKPCSPMPPEEHSPAPPVHRNDKDPAPAAAVDPAREAKASQILQALQLTSAPGTEAAHAQRTVDLVASDLVKQLDAANPAWTPQHPKWHMVLEFVKADLQKDAPSALRASAARTNQATAREYASHAQDSEMDALMQYLNSPEGARYISFQSELRSISNQALDSLMAQEAITAEKPGDGVLKHRQLMLSLSFDARFAEDGGGPAAGPSAPGSPPVLENTARREGTALDTLYNEYEAFLPGFAAFTQSKTARRFFAACEPALRTRAALSSVAVNEFADAEEANYLQRWRAYYGPPVRGSSRVTTVVRSGSTGVISTRQLLYNDSQPVRESAALQCEQRENAAYARSHRSASSQIDSQATLKALQNDCRREQGLPPL